MEVSKYYITRANLKRILPERILAKKYEIKNNKYYKDDIPYFTKEDKQYFLWIKIFLENPRVIHSYLKLIRKSVDAYNLMLPPSPPAYHFSIECSSLNLEYFNITLPEGIRDQENNALICRRIFNEIVGNKFPLLKPRYLSSDELDELLFELVQRLKMNPDIRNSFLVLKLNIDELRKEDFNKIIKPFSGKATIILIEKEIDGYIKDFENTYRKEALSKGYRKSNTIESFKQTYFANHYSRKITDLIIEYNIQKHCPDLKFDEDILVELGFHGCKICSIDSYEPDSIKPHSIEPVHGNEYLLSLNERIDAYIERCKELYTFSINVGEFAWENTLDNPISTEDVKKQNIQKGLFFAEHKFMPSHIQAIFKEDDAFVIVEVPKDILGNHILTRTAYVLVGKRNDLTEDILGMSTDVVLIPNNE